MNSIALKQDSDTCALPSAKQNLSRVGIYSCRTALTKGFSLNILCFADKETDPGGSEVIGKLKQPDLY